MNFGLYVVSLGGHHHGGDLINPLFIHFYFIPHPYNTILLALLHLLQLLLLSLLALLLSLGIRPAASQR